jgi:hypothetical protein
MGALEPKTPKVEVVAVAVVGTVWGWQVGVNWKLTGTLHAEDVATVVIVGIVG